MSLSIPAKFALPWGANAAATYIRSIPTPSQIGIQNGAASLNDGFPPLCFTPETAGGTPPFGQDFNGILNEITKIQQWQQAGGGWVYDGTYSTEIGGYPVNAILESAILPGRLWLNIVDGNTQNPDAYPFTGWVALPGNNPAGTPVPSFRATVLPGHVLANGQTIGNAGSGGTTAPTGLASATAFFLFCAIWSQFSQTVCPVQFNGVPVTRGANANADWAAGRTIATPQMSGAGVIGQDDMGGISTNFLTGVPVINGSLITAGSNIGEDRHGLIVGELPSITSTGGGLGCSVSGSCSGTTSPFNEVSGTASGGATTWTSQNAGTTFVGQSFSGSSSGSGSTAGQNVTSSGTNGTAHNNVQLSWTVAWNLAL